MDEIKSLLEYVILSYEGYALQVKQIVYLLGLILATIMVLRLGNWLIRKRFFLGKRFSKLSVGKDKVKFIYRFLVICGSIYLGLLLLGLNLNEVLDLTLLPLGNEKSIRLGNVIFGIAVWLVTRYLIANFRKIFLEEGKAKRLSLDQGRRMAIYQIIQYLAYLLGVIVIIGSLDIDLKAVLVGSAALFVGIGLALQNTFADILSGILILFDGTIEVGDWLMVNGRDIEGEVKEIRLRTTIVETLDSTSIIVPNRLFSDSDVLNWSYNDRETRFSIKVGVAYGSNLQTVRKVLNACAANHGRVLKSPEPKVLFKDFGDSALQFELVYWLANFRDHQTVESDIRFMIDSDFRKNKISIPFPQRDLHIITDATIPDIITEEEDEAPKLPG